MSEASLELRIILKADEATLRAIREKLGNRDNEARQVISKITQTTKNTLVEVGIANQLDIGFSYGYISHLHPATGGLDAQEWMSTDTPPEDITEPHSSKKYHYESSVAPKGGLDAQEWLDTETPPEDLDDKRSTE